MTTYNTTPLVRKERIGNFLWTIYTRSLPYQQQMLKDKLLQLSGGNEDKLWQTFLRYQTAPEKDSGFNADVIGIMVQVFCEEDIKVKFDKTDVEKLRIKADRIRLQEQQAKLF
jgi:hypothetical protein